MVNLIANFPYARVYRESTSLGFPSPDPPLGARETGYTRNQQPELPTHDDKLAYLGRSTDSLPFIPLG